MKKLFYLVIFCFITVGSFAQGLTITTNAPRVVAVGETFRVEFSMNGKPDNFKAPSFDGFELIAGPSVSQSNSISIVNGKRSSKSEYTYSYVLIAAAKGTYTIAVAEATADGKAYRSSPLPVEVVDDNSSTTGSQSGGTATQRPAGQAATTVSNNDIVLLMEVNKRSAYKGEAITAIVKLLTKVPIAGVEGAKTPSFAGFWQQELPNQNQQTEWTRMSYNNNVYDATVMKEFLLFPQQNGSITIDAMTMNLVVRIQDPNAGSGNSIFDSFFGGGSGYRDIRKVISTKPITITVKPYVGTQPASFNGAVGEFTMESELSSDVITANSASNFIIKLKGNGNLPLITEPPVELPSSFELYKIKSEEKINVTAGGVSGEKVFTYPFIARAQGDYTLNPIEFTYFSPSNGRFITLKSPAFKVAVSADTSVNGSNNGAETIISGVSKEELKILGKDINYIMTALPELQTKGDFLIWSPTHFMIVLAMIVVCIIILLLLRKMMKEAKDIVRVKSKRANRVALNRLKEAKKYLGESDSAAFYESVLKAMWGYVADKLNIDKASLSRDRVGEQLSLKGIDDKQKEQFLSVIASCEEARYSPVASSMMGEVYNTAIEVITKFENKL